MLPMDYRMMAESFSLVSLLAIVFGISITCLFKNVQFMQLVGEGIL